MWALYNRGPRNPAVNGMRIEITTINQKFVVKNVIRDTRKTNHAQKVYFWSHLISSFDLPIYHVGLFSEFC